MWVMISPRGEENSPRPAGGDAVRSIAGVRDDCDFVTALFGEGEDQSVILFTSCEPLRAANQHQFSLVDCACDEQRS